jgi:hypothetical protein
LCLSSRVNECFIKFTLTNNLIIFLMDTTLTSSRFLSLKSVLSNKYALITTVCLIGSGVSYLVVRRIIGNDNEGNSILKQEWLNLTDSHFEFQGLNAVFSKAIKSIGHSRDSDETTDYYLPIGLKNVANSCYMNALL